MRDKFNESLRRVLVHEGGKVDDPQDPGGRTNKGVTQSTYNAWRRTKGKLRADVYDMTSDECAAIYKERYWDVIKGDDLPPGVDYVVFDGAVNSGPSQSVKWLQRALGMTSADGQLGVMTLERVGSVNDHDALVASICQQRMGFLKSLKTWKRFGKGWSSRVSNILATGQAWAMGSVGPEVEYIPNGSAKAKVEDAKPAPTRGPADAATGVGGTVVAVTQTVNAAKDQLAPYASALPWINHAIVALTIGGLVLAVGGLAYRAYITRRRKERADALGLETT